MAVAQLLGSHRHFRCLCSFAGTGSGRPCRRSQHSGAQRHTTSSQQPCTDCGSSSQWSSAHAGGHSVSCRVHVVRLVRCCRQGQQRLSYTGAAAQNTAANSSYTTISSSSGSTSSTSTSTS